MCFDKLGHNEEAKPEPILAGEHAACLMASEEMRQINEQIRAIVLNMHLGPLHVVLQ